MIPRAHCPLKLDQKRVTNPNAYRSQALMAGIPEPVVREWVGHVDPAIIRLYTHVSEAASRRFIARFSEPEPGVKPRADEVSGEGDRGVA